MSIQPEYATSFRPEVVLEIIQGYWKLPAIVPVDFPHDYPPLAPLLDQPQPPATVNELRSAFTHNTVTYASAEAESNLILETFGDRVMGFLLTRLFHDDMQRNGGSSVYKDLDHGGFDFLLKALCTGSVQSFFAMSYNFPARMTIAHKAPKNQQIFSQRDMEGAFEAYLGVCMGCVGMEEVLVWFGKLLSPWISAYTPAAQQLQNERDMARASRQSSNPSKSDQWRSFRFERRAARREEVGTLEYIIHPTLEVKTLVTGESPCAATCSPRCEVNLIANGRVGSGCIVDSGNVLSQESTHENSAKRPRLVGVE